MLQKLKQLYWKIFFPKKFEDFKNPKIVTGTCQQCAYKFLSIKQNVGGKGIRRILCLCDKSVNPPEHTCSNFKKET